MARGENSWSRSFNAGLLHSKNKASTFGVNSFSSDMIRTIVAALATAGERPICGFAEQSVGGMSQGVVGSWGAESGTSLDETSAAVVGETGDVAREILENPTLGKIGVEFRYQIESLLAKWNSHECRVIV